MQDSKFIAEGSCESESVLSRNKNNVLDCEIYYANGKKQVLSYKCIVISVHRINLMCLSAKYKIMYDQKYKWIQNLFILSKEIYTVIIRKNTKYMLDIYENKKKWCGVKFETQG